MRGSRAIKFLPIDENIKPLAQLNCASGFISMWHFQKSVVALHNQEATLFQSTVIPAKAAIKSGPSTLGMKAGAAFWIPAFAGMT